MHVSYTLIPSVAVPFALNRKEDHHPEIWSRQENLKRSGSTWTCLSLFANRSANWARLDSKFSKTFVTEFCIGYLIASMAVHATCTKTLKMFDNLVKKKKKVSAW